jgi:hypothetical protein
LPEAYNSVILVSRAQTRGGSHRRRLNGLEIPAHEYEIAATIWKEAGDEDDWADGGGTARRGEADSTALMPTPDSDFRSPYMSLLNARLWDQLATTTRKNSTTPSLPICFLFTLRLPSLSLTCYAYNCAYSDHSNALVSHRFINVSWPR